MSLIRGSLRYPVASLCLGAILLSQTACSKSSAEGPAPTNGGECRSTDLETLDGMISQVFSPELPSAVQELWRPSWGPTYASVFLSDADSLEAFIYSEGVTDSEREAVEDVLISNLVRRPIEDDYWRLVISNESGAAPGIVSGFTSCPPRVEAWPVEAITEVGRRLNIQQRHTVVLRAFVNAQGWVEDVEVVESSGFLALDQGLADVVPQMRFRSARLEGIPVAVWSQFPITVQPPRR